MTLTRPASRVPSPQAEPTVLLQDNPTGQWLTGEDLQDIVAAGCPEDVPRVLSHVQDCLANGLSAVGFLCYEAAPAIDPALVSHPPGHLPPAWFAIFRTLVPASRSTRAATPAPASWSPEISQNDYQRCVARIRDYIEAGDTYQVNYTFGLRTPAPASPAALFAGMTAAPFRGYAAFIETDTFAICSASPELFLLRRGDVLLSRPMKGTHARGMTLAEDREYARRLRSSEKDRAENVMIVDMVRNDMGRIALPGTVQVARAHAVTAFPTVWQMTTDVACRTNANLPETMRALFPCASITGAPKVRTMQIIHDLEPSPRGVYTGTIGFCRPNNDWQFSVAIRTVDIDKRSQRSRYGVGSGIVWDSVDRQEFDECLLKATPVTHPAPAMDLLETLLWTPEDGYILLDDHLARVCGSAVYFGRPCGGIALRARLLAAAQAFDARPHRVRLLVDALGGVRIEATRHEPDAGPKPPWRVCFAPTPISPRNPFLYHKTTHRAVYSHARNACPEADDVLLWNGAGDVTESTVANLVIEKRGRYLTPPVSCGLLAGTMRAGLLRAGKLEEAVLSRQDVIVADRLFLINSVRGWIPAVLRPDARSPSA